jgi:hypothetical protein
MINKKALVAIDWDRMYKRYGQPKDIMVHLNVENFKFTAVPVKPVYNIGEKSGIRIHKVIFIIGWLLIKLFFWRMKKNISSGIFIPLFFFYFLGFVFALSSLVLFARFFFVWYLTGHIPSVNTLTAMLSFMSSSYFSLSAMWFDMEADKHLKV